MMIESEVVAACKMQPRHSQAGRAKTQSYLIFPKPVIGHAEPHRGTKNLASTHSLVSTPRDLHCYCFVLPGHLFCTDRVVLCYAALPVDNANTRTLIGVYITIKTERLLEAGKTVEEVITSEIAAR
jgi:hypothetical protein